MERALSYVVRRLIEIKTTPFLCGSFALCIYAERPVGDPKDIDFLFQTRDEHDLAVDFLEHELNYKRTKQGSWKSDSGNESIFTQLQSPDGIALDLAYTVGDIQLSFNPSLVFLIHDVKVPILSLEDLKRSYERFFNEKPGANAKLQAITSLMVKNRDGFHSTTEHHLATRPEKIIFPLDEQIRLRHLAIEAIKKLLLPDPGIKKVLLIGSSVKGLFGRYRPPGFRGSLFSDFDFIVYVTNRYTIPSQLKREPDGKPFSKGYLNFAYRIQNFVEEKYDAEIFFVRDGALLDESICEEGERAGIPMSEESIHPNIVVFETRNE